MNIIILIAAFALDLIAGDPNYPLHPIRLIGHLILLLQKLLYRIKYKKVAGFFLLFISLSIVFNTVFWGLLFLKEVHIFLYISLSIFISYSAISIKALIVETNKVYKALKSNNLNRARLELSYLVSRDTKEMTEEDVIRGAVETIAENFVDGVVSPLFYLSIGGPALAMSYKAVNTLDSMVGYKNEKYKDFGWASAKFDDLLNFIPARLAAFLIIPLAGLIFGKNIKSVFRVVIRDRFNHDSPNSGHSEAGFAAVLDLQFGGKTSYFGQFFDKPTIGDSKENFQVKHIKLAGNLLLVSSLICFVIFLVCKYCYLGMIG